MKILSSILLLDALDSVWKLSLILKHMVIGGVFRTESPLGAGERAVLQTELSKTVVILEALNSVSARDNANRVIRFLDQQLLLRDADNAIQGIRSAIHDEFQHRSILLLREDQSELLNDGHVEYFGRHSIDAFPSAVYDMSEACKCIALERWSACAYHCIGVFEVCLRALCVEINAQIDLDAKDCTWSKMHSAVVAELRPSGSTPARRKTSHSNTWGEDEPFFNECAAHIQTLQHCFRNPTMHFRKLNTGSEKEAKKVLLMTETFVEHLAKKVSE